MRGRAEPSRKRGRWKAGLSAWRRTATIRNVSLEPARTRRAVAPTHWSFGQLCTLIGAPTSYLRQLPAALSAINLNTACYRTAPSLSKPWKPTTDGSSFGR